MGYLASRVPVHTLLHLRHPEAEDPSAEHPWCAWDICEGGSHVPGSYLCLYFALSLLRGSATYLTAGHSPRFLSQGQQDLAWNVVGKPEGLLQERAQWVPPHSFLPPAWAEKRGYKTARTARNDVYRAANSLLRLALDGRLSLCFHPPGYSEQKGRQPSVSPAPAVVGRRVWAVGTQCEGQASRSALCS